MVIKSKWIEIFKRSGMSVHIRRYKQNESYSGCSDCSLLFCTTSVKLKGTVTFSCQKLQHVKDFFFSVFSLLGVWTAFHSVILWETYFHCDSIRNLFYPCLSCAFWFWFSWACENIILKPYKFKPIIK